MLSCVQPFATPWAISCQVPLSMEFTAKNTGVGCSLLQGIVLTQGSNQGLLHCRRILYCLSHQGSLIFWEGGDAAKPTSSRARREKNGCPCLISKPIYWAPTTRVTAHGALAHLPGTVLHKVNLLNSRESSGRQVPPLPF